MVVRFHHGAPNNAAVAQLVERNLAKVEVASSRLVSRSSFIGSWCSGSTTGFDPVSPSSILGGPAKYVDTVQRVLYNSK